MTTITLNPQDYGIDPPARKPINVAATEEALRPYIEGKGNLVVGPTGTLTTTKSPEFLNGGPEAERLTQIGTGLITY